MRYNRSNPMTGHSEDAELDQLLDSIKENAGFLNKLDYRALEYLAKKGMYAEGKLDLTDADYVPYITEVEKFNKTFGKPNNYEPTIPSKDEWMFVYNFILEELEEYKEACEEGDIVGILDALGDITYVSTGNGTMLHGLKDKFWNAYQEIQASNMSKSCKTENEALRTVELRSKEQGEDCHYEPVGDVYVVYRSRDKKVMKSINYFRPDLKKFFSKQELEK